MFEILGHLPYSDTLPWGYKTFFMLRNLKLLTTANSFLLNIAKQENFSNKYENANYCWHFHIY